MVLALAAVMLWIPTAAAQSTLRVATIGEPPMLDPMATTAVSTGSIAQHIFETLYVTDGNWDIAPMLAADLPQLSADGLSVTIPLRDGVRFHDGSVMDADDVVASLQRWLEVSTRGGGIAPFVESISASDPLTVEIVLNQRYAPLTAYLTANTAAAAIMPAEIASAEGPLDTYVGTGPFSFVEWRPDRYIRLAAFDDYSARSEPSDGYSGERKATVDEIQFIPVPDANTRLAGLVGGEYHFAEGLNTESIDRMRTSGVAQADVIEPFAYPVMIFNTVEGAAVDPDVRVAMQAALDLEAMMIAGLGLPEFYRLEGSWYPEGSPFYTTAGTDRYNEADVPLASQLLAATGYDGEPIRILTSQQYPFLYRMSVVAADNLAEAGFNVDLQVLEWATLTSVRGDISAWEAYWTYGSFNPEPTSYSFIVGPGAGGWTSDEKSAILDEMNSALTTAERAAAWAKMQELMYRTAPVIRVGEMYGLTGRSNDVTVPESYRRLPVAYYWNVSVH